MKKRKKCKTPADYKKKKARAIKTLNSYKNEDGTQKESSIEKKVREYLETLPIYFEQEYAIKCTPKGMKREYYRVYDFYVSLGNYAFLIECHGGYWHGQVYLEGKKSKEKLPKIVQKNIRNDKLKERIAREKGFPLIVLWENDIKNNFEEVRTRIKMEIKKGQI